MTAGPWAADLELALAAARVAAPLIMKSFRTKQDVHYKTADQPQTGGSRL